VRGPETDYARDCILLGDTLCSVSGAARSFAQNFMDENVERNQDDSSVSLPLSTCDLTYLSPSSLLHLLECQEEMLVCGVYSILVKSTSDVR
jgi:hypothetical protein